MPHRVRIELLPLGEVFEVDRGTSLQDLLFVHGVEFPCGGRGRCKGCRVRVLKGSLAVTEADRRKLSETELGNGWRLACCARVESELTLDLAQWEAAILSDDSAFSFVPQDGWGIAVDLGTTTIVAQLLDLRTGHVLGVRTALNAQARHGADIMSRVEFAVAEKGQSVLQASVREQIGSIIRELVACAREGKQSCAPAEETHNANEERRTKACVELDIPLKRVVLVGNTVMHHLFSAISVEPLSHFPFESPALELQRFHASDLNWNIEGDPEVLFLPCIGGFVGSDILAGILATRLHETEEFSALVDLGTNGEIVVGNRERRLCASTAAGPAFEGARISMGMRAASGAISEVHINNSQFTCHTIGNVPARGICGSGLVDAVASGLDLGWIQPNGRISQGEVLPLTDAVSLNQWDIRELQLAKGAIAAGLQILLQQWGASMEDLSKVYLAGAFGNYINANSARRIGLLNFAGEKMQPAGNTALLGAKLALFTPGGEGVQYSAIIAGTRHVSLHEDPGFQETYAAEMRFPIQSQSIIKQ